MLICRCVIVGVGLNSLSFVRSSLRRGVVCDTDAGGWSWIPGRFDEISAGRRASSVSTSSCSISFDGGANRRRACLTGASSNRRGGAACTVAEGGESGSVGITESLRGSGGARSRANLRTGGVECLGIFRASVFSTVRLEQSSGVVIVVVLSGAKEFKAYSSSGADGACIVIDGDEGDFAGLRASEVLGSPE